MRSSRRSATRGSRPDRLKMERAINAPHFPPLDNKQARGSPLPIKRGQVEPDDQPITYRPRYLSNSPRRNAAGLRTADLFDQLDLSRLTIFISHQTRPHPSTTGFRTHGAPWESWPWRAKT